MTNDHPIQDDIEELCSSWVVEIISVNPLLIEKIVTHTQEVDALQARIGLTEVVRFLWLCSESDAVLTPSQRVDEIWHQLILFTRGYQTFCAQNLKGFIHHQPSREPVNEQLQYTRTIVKYKSVFGTPDNNYWPLPNLNTAKEADCGNCEN
jgi:hypothetical protein